MNPRTFVAAVLAILVLIPMLSLYWVAKGGAISRSHALLKSAAAGIVIAALYIGAPWPVVSYFLRYLLLILLIGVVGYAWWRARDLPWWRTPNQVDEWVSGVAGVLVIAGFGFLLVQLVGANRVPDGAVELEFPFLAGTFVSGHAGSRPAMNAHMNVRNISRLRGQTWALDVWQIDRAGRRARGLYPRELERYRIFGTPVIAPCAGTVVRSANDFADYPPPERESDLAYAAGNFVLIQCDGEFFVVLAHLAQGSVQVQNGDPVTMGQMLGVIGNSGNTSEPHLHINAQTGPGDMFLLDADPLPIVFRGYGFLKRNDVVRVAR
jgi:hypothetical protein